MAEIKLITPGVIADQLHVQLNRVIYVLSTRNHIQPAARAGNIRLYSKNAVALVRHELNAISARNGASHAK